MYIILISKNILINLSNEVKITMLNITILYIVRRIYFRDYKKIIIIKNGEKVFKENDKQR